MCGQQQQALTQKLQGSDDSLAVHYGKDYNGRNVPCLYIKYRCVHSFRKAEPKEKLSAGASTGVNRQHTLMRQQGCHTGGMGGEAEDEGALLLPMAVHDLRQSSIIPA
jgi:hypothetical protein